MTPSVEETIKAISKLNNGKAPGVDSLNVELFKFERYYLLEMPTAVIQKGWKNEVMPKDWKDAVMEVVLKGKGQKDECNNFHGICLFATVGKVLLRIMVDRLQIYVANEILPEAQSGVRKGRGTVDMIFSAWQLQEKCVEQQIGFYQVFIDLIKAFDCQLDCLVGDFEET
eukprot:XP_014790513.1 PREDICTED: RNA-directed DNA polymerase from mobile element jockey-like [Octopus bimaculoides]